MKKTHKITLPLFIMQGVKKIKKIYLNLNVMKNLFHHTYNKVKQEYQNGVAEQLYDVAPMNNIALYYEVFKNDKRSYDIMNVVSIQDKFFQDALVQEQILEDDNYNNVKLIIARHGGVDKDNPRVDVSIINLDRKEAIDAFVEELKGVLYGKTTV